MKPFFFVYLLTAPDGRAYVGKTSDLCRRIHEHKFRKSGPSMQGISRALNSLGWENFSVELLHVTRTEDEATELETREIGGRRTFLPEGGFNVSGPEESPERKAARSAAALKRMKAPGHREKLQAILTERNRSPEHKAKVAAKREAYWAKVRSGEIVRNPTLLTRETLDLLKAKALVREAAKRESRCDLS
jgi:group I intron endonuclease